MLKRQAQEAVEDMEEMRRTHKDNANVSMQLLKKVLDGVHFVLVLSLAPGSMPSELCGCSRVDVGGYWSMFGNKLSVAVM